MTTIVTRVGKGSPLTWTEVDSNFTNLNNAKYESGNNASFGTISGTTITASSGFSGALNGTVGATTPASGSFTSLTDSGNLTFTGTGNRITGDFSNNTIANRVMFQTSTTNAQTAIEAIPNGTSLNSRFVASSSSSDPANSSIFDLAMLNATDARLSSSIRGTGTYLPMTFYTGGSERMRIDTSGNLAIGTTNPAGFKTLISDGTTSIAINLLSNVGYIGTITNHPLAFITNNSERMRITSGGEVYIAGTTDQGAYNLQCNGTGVWGAGAYVNGSDARIKKDINPIDSGLDVVIKLNPVTYKYKEDWSKDQSTQTGFIAQELLVALEGKNYVDGVVQQGGKYMSVAYQNIIPILTKAIQELKAELDTVKAELNTLKGN